MKSREFGGRFSPGFIWLERMLVASVWQASHAVGSGVFGNWKIVVVESI